MKICLKCSGHFESPGWACPACGYVPQESPICVRLLPDTGATVGFEETFFDNLSPHEASNFWFRNRNRLIQWAVAKYFSGAQSMLEIGCGTGYVLSGLEQSFPDLSLQGSEYFEAGLSVAAKRLRNARLYQMDARSMPFEEEFDVIGAFDVLEHIEEDERVLREIRRTVKPGGGVILTVPQHPWLWSAVDDYSHHMRRYTAEELRSKVESAGFTIKRMTSFVTLLVPLMFISRSRKTDHSVNPSSELTIPRWQNAILETLLRIEQTLIRQGVNLPIGGSLLLVGYAA